MPTWKLAARDLIYVQVFELSGRFRAPKHAGCNRLVGLRFTAARPFAYGLLAYVLLGEWSGHYNISIQLSNTGSRFILPRNY